MAISPTVAAWQTNAQQPQQNDADTMFRNSFQEQAFGMLRVKAPTLVPYVVTFKIFDSNVESGDAFGAFAVTSGDDIVFVPVVMVGGAISSCEMIYNRTTDMIGPMLSSDVKEIVDKNNNTQARPLQGSIPVEDTRNLFRNLVRPPQSSNVVMASCALDMSILPNEAKQKVAEYLEKHPQLLGKIAEFYPVELLAERLSPTTEKTASDDIPEIVKLDDITKEAVELLNERDLDSLRTRGWFFTKDAGEFEPKIVFDSNNVGAEIKRRFYQYDTGDIRGKTKDQDTEDRTLFKTAIVCLRAGKIVDVDAITCGRYVYDTRERKIDRYVFSEQKPASEKDLFDGGFVSVLDLKPDSTTRLYVFAIPRKDGTYTRKSFSSGYCKIDRAFFNDSGDYVVCFDEYPIGKELVATKSINFGCYESNGILVVPRNTLVCKEITPGESTLSPISGYISKISDLQRIITSLGTTLRVSPDGKSVTDYGTEKTASFASVPDTAEYLYNTYNLSGRQIDDVLSREKSLVLTKFAVGELTGEPQPQPQPQPQQQLPSQAGMPPAGQPMQSGTAQVPAQNLGTINSFANLGDPDLIDAGVLASFSGDPDVRTLLVDYYPDFLTILDRIGRSILLFNIQKSEIEKYYQTEKVAEMLQSLRKVFKIIGELVQSLKVYINMA